MLQNRAGMLGLNFEVAGVNQVSRILAISAERVTDLRPALEKIADDFYKGESKVFFQQGAVGEATEESGQGTWEKWVPVNPEYARWKMTHGYGNKILVKTGRLKASLKAPGGTDGIRIISKLSMELGTAVPYAQYHQSGTRKMPKREPLRVTKTQARFWVQLINAFLLAVGERERKHL